MLTEELFMLITSIFIFFSYLLGSLSAAIISCRLMGLDDPRTGGSNNPGTTNVYKLYGKKPAIFTLVGDLLKGLIPVLFAKLYGMDSVSLSLIALASFLGHLYPLFFAFKGGKGVATLFGILIALNIYVAGLSLLTWLVMIKLFKLSSLAALVSSLLMPLYFYIFDIHFVYIGFVFTAFIIWRHQSNIIKIVEGTED